MKLRINEENTEADALIPPNQPDNSGIGVNYADAYLQAMNIELEDGRTVVCKRKGLRVNLAVGDAKGEALMRKREHGPDPKQILQRALEEAADAAGLTFVVEGGTMYFEEQGNKTGIRFSPNPDEHCSK